jgi:peptidoglycan/LPS O-acetylase OafA/YrhL
MVLHFVGGITPENVFERAAAKVSSYGLWGVDLFFVLSGYLITGILHDSKGDQRYFRNFYMRRTLRIFPLYYGVLLVLILVPAWLAQAVLPGVGEVNEAQGWLWPYATNLYLFREGGFVIPYVSHFWSLAIEEHFYLFWPFLIGFLSRTAALRAAFLIGASALLLRIVLSFMGMNSIQTQVLTPCRLDALCAGAWFALAARGPDRPSLDRVWRWLAASTAAIVAISLWHAATVRLVEVSLPLRGSLLAVFFGCFIFIAAQDGAPAIVKHPLRTRWLILLGKYSYGLYVFHGIVAYALHQHGAELVLTQRLGSHALAVILQAAIGVSLSLLIAVMSYELFESRFLKLKKWFSYQCVAKPARTKPALVELAR